MRTATQVIPHFIKCRTCKDPASLLNANVLPMEDELVNTEVDDILADRAVAVFVKLVVVSSSGVAVADDTMPLAVCPSVVTGSLAGV